MPSSIDTLGFQPNSLSDFLQSKEREVLIVGWVKSCSINKSLPEKKIILLTKSLIEIALP